MRDVLRGVSIEMHFPRGVFNRRCGGGGGGGGSGGRPPAAAKDEARTDRLVFASNTSNNTARLCVVLFLEQRFISKV